MRGRPLKEKPLPLIKIPMTVDQRNLIDSRIDQHMTDFIRERWTLWQFARTIYLRGVIDGKQLAEDKRDD